MQINGMSPAKAMKSMIPCKVSRGMFSNEYAVTIELVSGELVSLFVDENLVVDMGNGGNVDDKYLAVNTAETAAGEKMVLLPTEALEKGTRWVQVHRDRIQIA